ncbi:MAG: T9SS type A sorting domain-containing protein [Parvicellaceae bacterium]
MKNYFDYPRYIFLICILSFKISFSQNGNLSLDNLNIFEYNSQVYVDVTISSGNTCNGIKLLRSSDSVYYEEIAFIDGVCGFSSSPSSYSLIDPYPILNSYNYYKILFGSNTYSTTYQILILNFEKNNYQIWPNPVSDMTTIYFQNPQSKLYSFNLFNISGKKLLSVSTIEDKYNLNCKNYNSGIYFFTLSQSNNQTLYSGKLIICK